MPTVRLPTDGQLLQAAELRVLGNSWERAASEMKIPVGRLRQWPVRYRGRWRKIHADAERRLMLEATAEAVATLRKQLRSKDEKSSRDAAQKIVQIRIALQKSRNPKRAKGSPQTDLGRAAAYLEGLNREETEELLGSGEAGDAD